MGKSGHGVLERTGSMGTCQEWPGQGRSTATPRYLPAQLARNQRRIKGLPSTFVLPRRGLPCGDWRSSVQVAAERCAVPCLVVLVGEGTLVGLARLGYNDRSPSGNGAT